MKKPLLIIILASSPQTVASFARYPRRRLTAASIATVGPSSKTEQASLSSVAYSFRQPDDDDDATYSEESISSILSNGDDDDPTATNGSNTNDNGIEKDEIIMDIVGSGTLGDIMSGTPDASAQAATSSLQFTPITTSNNNNNPSSPSSSQVIDGLVTKEGGELNTRFNCDFTPMERIALTSNGNLQRIFSSYYDAPVHVHIDFCERRSSSLNDSNNGDDGSSSFIGEINNNNNDNNNTNDNAAIWDRIVHIHVHGQTICKATSIISVKDPVCVRLIEDGTVGLGQLFRYLNRLPTFSLVDAGRRMGSRSTMAMDHPFSSSFNIDNDIFDSGMWRTYELKCEEMTCLIHEEFREDAWNISPLDSNGSDGPFQPMI